MHMPALGLVDTWCTCGRWARSARSAQGQPLPHRSAPNPHCLPNLLLHLCAAPNADKVGALLMMDMAHISGLVAAQEAAQVRRNG